MNTTVKNYIRITIVVILSALFIVTLNVRHWLTHQPPFAVTDQNKPPQAWMTVWVHGSFATMIGLISVFNVIKDKVHQTNYKKMTRLMRKDPFFFQLQPLQERGLKPVSASFDSTGLPIKCAAVLVSAAYETLTAYAQNEQEKNYFYTFGWSGLISQYQRRKEAITLYADLAKEYAAFTAKGITPKVRLIAHSHGGNLILNAAGIHEILQKGLDNEPSAQRYPDPDQLQSMKELHHLLKEYKKTLPAVAPFHIDEFIMLGTPIQPETLSFCLSPFFKKIYHFYSDDDIIQGMDWVSTRRYYSEKRIALTPITTNQPTIMQLKITLNKPTPQNSASDAAVATPALSGENTTTTSASDPAPSTISSTLSSLWGRLFGYAGRTTLDPLHKEFWFMGWKTKDKQELAQQHIQPYPYAILIPYFKKLTACLHEMNDLDIHLKFTPEHLAITGYKHDTTNKQRTLLVNREILKELQEKARTWQPDNVTPSYEMEILHRYSKMLES